MDNIHSMAANLLRLRDEAERTTAALRVAEKARDDASAAYQTAVNNLHRAMKRDTSVICGTEVVTSTWNGLVISKLG